LRRDTYRRSIRYTRLPHPQIRMSAGRTRGRRRMSAYAINHDIRESTRWSRRRQRRTRATRITARCSASLTRKITRAMNTILTRKDHTDITLVWRDQAAGLTRSRNPIRPKHRRTEGITSFIRTISRNITSAGDRIHDSRRGTRSDLTRTRNIVFSRALWTSARAGQRASARAIGHNPSERAGLSEISLSSVLNRATITIRIGDVRDLNLFRPGTLLRRTARRRVDMRSKTDPGQRLDMIRGKCRINRKKKEEKK
jgi:hypothetical protein